jgi:hypothetical protein
VDDAELSSPDEYLLAKTCTNAQCGARMQIRRQLDKAGLDPASVAHLQDTLAELKAAMAKAEEGQGRGSGSQDNKIKAGRLALGLWDRLLVVLAMMYETCGQAAGVDESSNYRLVVSRWIERLRPSVQKQHRCAACSAAVDAPGWLHAREWAVWHVCFRMPKEVGFLCCVCAQLHPGAVWA